MAEGEMTVREAGRLGGAKCRDTHGIDHYRQAGHKGGTKTAETHGKEHFVAIGKIGGSKGGKRTAELIRKGRALEASEESLDDSA